MPQTRFGTRVSTLPSGTEEAPPPLLTHFGPRGSTSLGGPPTSSQGLPRTLGHEVGCKSFDSGVGVQYPAGGCRTRRRSHGRDRLPLSIPSVGRSRGRHLGAGQEHPQQGAQQERGSWATPMGSHHLLKSIVGTSRDVTSWVQAGAVLPQEFGELQGSRYCRPPSPRGWPWKVLSQLSGMNRSISCRPFRPTRHAWFWICMPTREAFRTV